MAQTIPQSIRLARPLDIEPALSESEVLAGLRELANRNEVYTSLIGQGYYGTILPPVIRSPLQRLPHWHSEPLR